MLSHCSAGLLSFPYMVSSYRRGWRVQSERDVTKVNRLRAIIMQHLVRSRIVDVDSFWLDRTPLSASLTYSVG